MKMLVSFFAFALSLSSFASTVDSKTFVYDGSQNSAQLQLKAEKTHTEYRTEQQRSTCYRTEVVGYTTYCSGGYGGGYGRGYPYPGGGYPYPGGGYPYPGGYRNCYQQPVYGQVAYSCIQTVKIPFEVRDYDVEANVLVDVTNMSSMPTTGETFKVTLNGETLSFEATGSKTFLIVNKKQDIRVTRTGAVKMLDAVIAAELIPSAPLLSTLKMSNMLVTGSVLNFNVAGVNNNLGFSLKVIKKRTLRSDPVLFNRDLTSNEVVMNGSVVGINMKNLGINLYDGKFEITARSFIKFDGAIMNASQFGDDLETSRTLILKTN